MATSEFKQGHRAALHQMGPWISQLKARLRVGELHCLILPCKLSHLICALAINSHGSFQLLLLPHSHGPYAASADPYTELSPTSARNSGIFGPNDLCFITRE